MKLWPAKELAEHDFPEETFLLDPVVPLGGKTLLYGKRGVGKTQLCMTIANAIVNGWDLFGRFPVQEGNVVFVQADMTPQLQQLRLRKIIDHLNVEGTFYLIPEGEGLQIPKMRTTHPATVQEIKELEPKLIVWDTLRRLHRLEENDSATPQIVYSALDELFPKATNWLNHHEKKSPADPDLSPDPDEAFRGSGDWIDSVDTAVRLKELRDDVPKRLQLTFPKARTASKDEADGVLLEMDPKTMLLTPVQASPRKDADAVLQDLSEHRADLFVEELVKRGACTRKLAWKEAKRRKLPGAGTQ